MFTLEGITGGKNYVLAAAQQDRRWRAMPAKPAGMAMDICRAVAETIGKQQMAAAVASILTQVYEAYVGSNGVRPGTEGPEQDEWDSALDDIVQEEFEPFANVLSNSFFGEATVDTQLQREGEIDRLAAKFAKEAWQTLTWEKSTAKILSAVGIVMADVEALPGVIAGTAVVEEDDDTPTDYGVAPMSNSILNKIILYTMGVVDDDAFEMILDTDDNLSASGGARLGIEADEARSMRAAYRMDPGQLATWKAKVAAAKYLPEVDDVTTIDGIVQPPDMPAQLVREAKPIPIAGAGVSAPPAAPSVPPVPAMPVPSLAPVALPSVPVPTLPGAVAFPTSIPASPVQHGPPAAPSPAGALSVPPLDIGPGPSPTIPGGLPQPGTVGIAPNIPPEVLKSLKENGGFRDQDMANAMGVSRPTMNNYVIGKSVFTPSADQLKTLQGMALQRAEDMVDVLSALTGNKYTLTVA